MEENRDVIQSSVDTAAYRRLYSDFADQNPLWNQIPSSAGLLYKWDPNSTYIQEPPFFESNGTKVGDVRGARPLAIFGDSVTTDHISPAGSIKKDSPAGRYLIEHGVKPEDFNSYGSRRGNHEVMMRGTFANVRLQNLLAPGTEGGVTRHLPGGEPMSIYDAAMKYEKEGVPLLIIAG